ncbi:hypothetical protein MGN70_006363 [Eutypa lata]|nr:hypothetical protein MGN70_006363 [Eutypa lata]
MWNLQIWKHGVNARKVSGRRCDERREAPGVIADSARPGVDRLELRGAPKKEHTRFAESSELVAHLRSWKGREKGSSSFITAGASETND